MVLGASPLVHHRRRWGSRVEVGSLVVVWCSSSALATCRFPRHVLWLCLNHRYGRATSCSAAKPELTDLYSFLYSFSPWADVTEAQFGVIAELPAGDQIVISHAIELMAAAAAARADCIGPPQSRSLAARTTGASVVLAPPTR